LRKKKPIAVGLMPKKVSFFPKKQPIRTLYYHSFLPKNMFPGRSKGVFMVVFDRKVRGKSF
jgi:hypothetical protein